MSDSYGRLEKVVARVLSRMPFLKAIAKNIYSRLAYLRAKKKYLYEAVQPVKAVLAMPDTESFFGYYDKTPMSESGLVLAHVTDASTDRKPDNDCIRILVVVKDTQEVLFEVTTRTYNWQQGARAHWLNDDLFIFNDFDKESASYISRVFSIIKREEVKRFNLPVQDSFKTDFFLSLNYKRLMKLRPDYGYLNLPELSQEEVKNTSDDGVWIVDFNTGESRLLFSIDDVLKVNTDKEFESALHKINHILISPDGQELIFLHRYFIGKRRVDRLMLARVDGTMIKVLADFGMVSHCFWADGNTILSYLRGPSGKDAYWLINTDSCEFSLFSNEMLDMCGDGHPHVVGDWFITDTYPNKARMQQLFLCNWKTNEVKKVGEFFHGFNFVGETRCDLHPRLSADGKTVFFDSVFEGRRGLYCMELLV